MYLKMTLADGHLHVQVSSLHILQSIAKYNARLPAVYVSPLKLHEVSHWNGQ